MRFVLAALLVFAAAAFLALGALESFEPAGTLAKGGSFFIGFALIAFGAAIGALSL